MARIYAPASSLGPLVSGAVGGLVAGGLAAVALAAASIVRGAPAVEPINALGAWLVRWLQTAGPDAFRHTYPDATPGGVATILVVSTALGAAFGALMNRLPQDHPVAWGLMTAGLLWVASWEAVLPALDPVAKQVLEPAQWLAGMAAYGLALGLWVHGDRTLREAERLSEGWAT
jgi:hypothetical protein